MCTFEIFFTKLDNFFVLSLILEPFFQIRNYPIGQI